MKLIIKTAFWGKRSTKVTKTGEKTRAILYGT